MPFIGNKPTAIPLSANDLEDNIISTAKIQDNAVTAAKYIEPIPFRNIIINGDMSIAQRGTSTASITADGYYTIDRMKTVCTTMGTWTQSQSTDVPTGQGFANSLKMDCTTADASPASGDVIRIQHRIEGLNLQYLKKGTSNAESTTVSFWVKSNKTGTYIIELYDVGNARQISKSYTIDSASTWEKKTITFAGDTTGAIDNDNSAGLQFGFYLGAGSNYTSGTLNTSWNSVTTANRAVGQVNLADSTANEFFITGIQLEAGTTASDFEFLPVDVNLQRCLRYYEKKKATTNYGNYANGQCNSTTVGQFTAFCFLKRANPTISFDTAGNFIAYSSVGGGLTITSISAFDSQPFSFGIVGNVASGLVAGNSTTLASNNNTNSFIEISSEL